MSPSVPARLICLNQAAEPIVLAEGAGRVTLGRDADQDIVLDDPSVSARHAIFELSDGRWKITDAPSRNGTELRSPDRSSKRLRGDSSYLRHGDELVFGNTPFRFHHLGAPDRGETEITSPPAGKVGLSPPQYQVLMGLCRPLREEFGRPPASNAEIAAALHLSEDGVRTHLRRLYARFGITEGTQTQRRAELAAKWPDAEIRGGSERP